MGSTKTRQSIVKKAKEILKIIRKRNHRINAQGLPIHQSSLKENYGKLWEGKLV